MSNKLRGEIPVIVGDGEYTFVFSVNALVALEERLGETVMSIGPMVASADKMRFGTLRTMFWAGLREHHPDISLEDAGRIMTELTVLGAMRVIAQAFEAAFPDAGDGAVPLGGAVQSKPIGLHS